MIILNEIKIKYDHLDTLLEEKLQDIRFSNNVNVIIDLKEIYRKFFRPNMLTVEGSKKLIIEEISSDVINIISHYRNYFYKKGKYSSFYFLYSKEECEIFKKIYPEYKKSHYEKHFDSIEDADKIAILKKVTEVLEKIIPNIPNTIFINTSKYDEFVVAKFIVAKSNSNEINIVLSNDEVFTQLVDGHTFLLNIKGINTDLVDSSNAVANITKSKSKLSSNMIPFILAFGGTKHYSLNNFPGIALIKAVNIIEQLLKENSLSDNSFVEFPEFDKTQNTFILENYNELKLNYEIITGNKVLFSNTTDISTLFNKPKAPHSWNYFLELNSKIFTNFPLMLDMMLKGETAV